MASPGLARVRCAGSSGALSHPAPPARAGRPVHGIATATRQLTRGQAPLSSVSGGGSSGASAPAPVGEGLLRLARQRLLETKREVGAMKVVSGPINWVEVGNDRLHADQGELTLFVARESSNSWLFWASRPGPRRSPPRKPGWRPVDPPSAPSGASLRPARVRLDRADRLTPRPRKRALSHVKWKRPLSSEPVSTRGVFPGRLGHIGLLRVGDVAVLGRLALPGGPMAVLVRETERAERGRRESGS